MNKSESIQNLSTALVKAQAEMPAVPFNQVNPFYKSRYADLGAIIETAKPILAKHGLAVSQLVTTSGERVGIETVLIHTSGEWISTKAGIAINEAGKSSAQAAGSVITYFRRYALAAMLGMYADEDRDGNEPKPVKPERKPNTQILTELGFEPMSIEAAGKVTDSNGTPYIEIPSARLRYMVGSINKAIKNNGHDLEKLATLQDKQAAAKAILKARAEGAINEL